MTGTIYNKKKKETENKTKKEEEEVCCVMMTVQFEGGAGDHGVIGRVVIHFYTHEERMKSD